MFNLTLEQKLEQIKSYPKSELLRNLENEIKRTEDLERIKNLKQDFLEKAVDAWSNKNRDLLDAKKEIEALKKEIEKLKK